MAVAALIVSVWANPAAAQGPFVRSSERPSALRTVGAGSAWQSEEELFGSGTSSQRAEQGPERPRIDRSYPSGAGPANGFRALNVGRTTPLKPRVPRAVARTPQLIEHRPVPAVTRAGPFLPPSGRPVVRIAQPPTVDPAPAPAPMALPAPMPALLEEPSVDPMADEDAEKDAEADAAKEDESDRPTNSLMHDTRITDVRASAGDPIGDLTPKDYSAEFADGAPILDNPDRVLDWMRDCPGPQNYVFCHRPLYFEDKNLERQGYSRHEWVQPISSAAYFFGTIPVLPYKMGVDLPQDCVRGSRFLGPCRKYSWRDNYLAPWSWRGATFQAISTTGLVYIIP